MSRQYDQSFLDVPMELALEDYVYDGYTQFKRIDGFWDYFITDDGRVISMVKEEPHVLRPWHNNHGHEYVKLRTREGYREKVLVHRLVAEAFIPNPEGYPIVRHLDDDPENNYVENLAWGTHKDNSADCIRNDHDYRKPVYCFETDTVYRSGVAASRDTGVPKSQITFCCTGASAHGHGYHFCFEEDIDERKRDLRWMRNRQYKPIKAYGPNGEALYFESRSEAARELGIPNCGISSVVNGHLKHTHGWRFKEGE